jgi:hypothetical protein
MWKIGLLQSNNYQPSKSESEFYSAYWKYGVLPIIFGLWISDICHGFFSLNVIAFNSTSRIEGNSDQQSCQASQC